MTPLRITCLALLMILTIACEKDPSLDGGRTPRDTSGTNGTDPPLVIPPGCGDGELADNEACDDGNNVSGDGCAGDCSHVELGWSCYPPGAPCQRVAVCGDGIVVPPEQCDDGNLNRGDGCSDLCQVEIGFKCDGNPSVCTPTVCGDGIVEGAEGCDDGNNIPFDGCDARCQLEPDCSRGACTSECGDGLVMGDEECDDGNNIDGDGCSADCKVEPGYECVQEGCVDAANCVLRIAVIYRDFTAAHTDFGLPRYPDMTCDTGNAPARNMVQTTLGSDWKPVQASPPANACASRIADWYSNAAATAVEVGHILLYPDGSGNYVNRYGPNGEQWQGQTEQPISDQPCTGAALGVTCLPCRWVPNQSCGIVPYDGNPLFFPIDHLGTDMDFAKIPEQYGYDGWPWEYEIPGFSQTRHNFYFTSEVTYWFLFDETRPATLNFTGDDDVWVFVNGQLAVDLGGAHVPLNGSVTISATNNFGMTHGNVYRINIFHAERKMEGSSFKLTLGGFNTARSECRPKCGDGIVGLGEECDDGINEGGYGKCGPGCKWGARCGDGIHQAEHGEHCDDGLDNGKPGKCPTSCRMIDID